MTLPNLKHLQYLLALHKQRHFHRAAQACFVSQSTLSSAIIKLEEQLDCQLIERNHKTFIFTPQGETIVKLAKQLLVSATEMVDFAKQQGKPNAGSIRIGCIPTIAPFLLTDLVKSCQKNLPELELYLKEDTTENLISQLAQGEVDTVILAFPIPAHGFNSCVLGKDNFYIAGEKELVDSISSNAQQSTLNYQQLPPQSIFLLSQDHCLSEHAVSACQLSDQSLINPFSATSLSTLVQMTAYHKGVTFLPKMAVDQGLGSREGLSINKLSDNFYREIGMLWRPTSMKKQTFRQLAGIVELLLK
ncbi:MAG: hydrogen peroxide-inducible genes activator [Colwellia sp.]|nr:hydrogen peroxide-inducible genes activator [Colwellia sp.]